MDEVRRVIWFWQRIVSPHMAGLATALVRQGCDVVYVAEQVMSAERTRQGWTPPELMDVRLEIATSASEVRALAGTAPFDSIHICQGVRANGLAGEAQRALAHCGLKQWVVMETVDDSGWHGVFKRLEYRRLFMQWRKRLGGVLAIGLHTSGWIAARGMPAERVYPFAYFLPGCSVQSKKVTERHDRFRFAFVGQFIELKRLDLLISALATLGRTDIELAVIGSGSLENNLRTAAEAALPGQVDWIGRLPMSKVQQEMSKADCLVLPSRYDGWGAVVSEALMAGTPAICSDRCGSAVAVHASGHGGVFRSGDAASLVAELEWVLEKGKLSEEERLALAGWAQCLGTVAGAGYLNKILSAVYGTAEMPLPPWQSNSMFLESSTETNS